MEEAVAEKAKSKQVATLKQNASVLQKSEKRDVPVHTDETLAQMAGVSCDTIQKTRTILKQGTDEQKQIYRGYDDRPEPSHPLGCYTRHYNITPHPPRGGKRYRKRDTND